MLYDVRNWVIEILRKTSLFKCKPYVSVSWVACEIAVPDLAKSRPRGAIRERTKKKRKETKKGEIKKSCGRK